MIPAAPAADRIAQLVAAAGRVAEVSGMQAELRDHRWAVRMPGELMVWIPADADGAQRLGAERYVLRLLEQRCHFRVPVVLHEDVDGSDVRVMVPGVSDPLAMVQRLRMDPQLAGRFGHALGQILAEQHGVLAPSEVPASLRRRVSWPMPLVWIRERLPKVLDDTSLLPRLERVLSAYEAQPVNAADQALVHGDFGFHNIATDAAGDVVGVFDYDEAAWDDRHHDFRYLEYEVGQTDVLEAAIAAYEAITGVRIDRQRVRLLHAVSAISFLANRDGIAPDTAWCGRTLQQDLEWVRSAVAGVSL